ncbi:MAG: cyclic nucleotide-binding domain-containing protein [Terracidiphilus sp.]
MKLDPSAFLADPDLIQVLEERSAPVPCSGDRVLFHQGEMPSGLYILDSGHATLTMKTPSGQPVVDVEARAGSLLGLPGLIGNEPYTLTAIARNGAQIRFVSRDDLNALMKSTPAVAIKILQVLAAEVRSARRAMADR